MAINLFYPNSNVIFYSLNRPSITAYISALRTLCLVPMILIIVPKYGVIGAAWSLVAVNSLIIIVDYIVLFHVTDISPSRIFSVLWRSTLAVTVMAVVVTLVLHNPFTPAIQESTILHLASCAATGAAVYVLVVSSLWWLSGAPEGAEAYVFRMAKKLYSRGAQNWTEKIRTNP